MENSRMKMIKFKMFWWICLCSRLGCVQCNSRVTNEIQFQMGFNFLTYTFCDIKMLYFFKHSFSAVILFWYVYSDYVDAVCRYDVYEIFLIVHLLTAENRFQVMEIYSSDLIITKLTNWFERIVESLNLKINMFRLKSIILYLLLLFCVWIYSHDCTPFTIKTPYPTVSSTTCNKETTTLIFKKKIIIMRKWHIKTETFEPNKFNWFFNSIPQNKLWSLRIK